jgi:hypothetical protein
MMGGGFRPGVSPARSPRYRPTPEGPERSRAVEQRRSRAAEEPLDVRLRRADVYPVLEVRNPIHGTAYTVLLPEFPSLSSALCSCTDFARRGLGTCKHIEAAHRWRSQHPDAIPDRPPADPARRGGPVWREIDRRLRELSGDPRPPSLRYRRPGDVLFEKGLEPSA